MTRLAGLAAAAALLAACEQSPPAPEGAVAPAAKLQVTATFYPLHEFTRQIAGDTAEVASLVPAGVEPHDWQPSPQDIARVARARVFVRNGAGLEPWADKLLATLAGKGPRVIDAAAGIALLDADDLGHDGETPGEPGSGRGRPRARATGQAEDGARKDPHVWLDPVLAQAQVETIRAGLTAADPARAAAHAAGASALTAQLAALHARFEQGLANCARREMVVSHAAFGYPARRYRLTQVPVMGLSPQAEPSPAEMTRIVRFARRHAVRYIFLETLVAPKLAETLAREVGARTLVLNPIEGLTRAEAEAGKGYVALMEDNLANLRTGLDCR